MSYLELIPSELVHIILLYVEYTPSVILKNIYNLDIDYKYLLRLKYRNFYDLIQVIKTNDRKYENYSYERAYQLINLIEDYVSINYNGTHTSNYKNRILRLLRYDDINNIIDFIEDNDINVEEIYDIISAYKLVNIKNNPLSKNIQEYKQYLPPVKYSDYFLAFAINQYTSNINETIDRIKRIVFNDPRGATINMIILFLSLLDQPHLISEYKNKIKDMRLTLFNGKRFNLLIIYQAIINYIE